MRLVTGVGASGDLNVGSPKEENWIVGESCLGLVWIPFFHHSISIT